MSISFADVVAPFGRGASGMVGCGADVNPSDSGLTSAPESTSLRRPRPRGAVKAYIGQMAPTSTKVRAREAARRTLLQRKEELDAEKRRRDERETDLATDFLLGSQDRDTARAAERDAEVAMGRAVDALVTDLRLQYARLADLLGQPESELKRLRQLAIEATRDGS
ncbi:hypothetical protein [Actinokineospora sp. NPDC004072]